MKWLLPFGAFLLVSCQSIPQSEFCDIARPIRLSPELIDQLTDQQVEDILSLNEKGRALCRWKPS